MRGVLLRELLQLVLHSHGASGFRTSELRKPQSPHPPTPIGIFGLALSCKGHHAVQPTKQPHKHICISYHITHHLHPSPFTPQARGHKTRNQRNETLPPPPQKWTNPPRLTFEPSLWAPQLPAGLARSQASSRPLRGGLVVLGLEVSGHPSHLVSRGAGPNPKRQLVEKVQTTKPLCKTKRRFF